MLDIIKVIEKIKDRVKPDIIYTHHRDDLNIDHKITYNAVLTATRPIKGETVKEIYSFDAPSSTEWNYPCTFTPDIFVDITDTLNEKIKALKCYTSEIRNFPHPRSIEGLKINARYWGMRAGLKSAEAFKLVRSIK